jgi:glycosyltransferase involved in cell wall biosynthesis
MPLMGAARPLRRVFMTADAVGGVWTYALDLARGFGKRGIETHLAVLGPSPSPAQAAEAAAIPRLELIDTRLALDWTAAHPREIAATSTRLKDLAGSSGADLVHLNGPALAGRSTWPVPLVIGIHSCVATWWQAVRTGDMPRDFVWRTRATASGLAVADAILAPSAAFAAAVNGCYGAHLEVTPVPNGRRRINCARAERRAGVLTAGRLWDPAKNVATLDEVAAAISEPVFAAGPVAGPNGERATFSNLKLLGELSEREMATCHANAAVFVSLSLYEPFGLAVLEAAQSGAALVLSDIATFRELWDGAALFVPAHDSAAAREAMQRLLRDPPLARRMGDKAAARADRYTPQRMLEATLYVYAGAMGRAAPQLRRAGAP